MEKAEYKIPGMPDVGTPGNRKPVNAKEIEKILGGYNQGKGMLVNQLGMIQEGGQLVPSDQSGPLMELRNIRTSMGA
jgi:hypothetical protein